MTNNLTGIVFVLALLVWALVMGVIIVASWKLYEKMGHPGWKGIIPIYQWFVMTKSLGWPVWWMLLFFVPIVNFVMTFKLSIDLAKGFGKSLAYGIFMVPFGIILMPMLAFGPAQFQRVE